MNTAPVTKLRAQLADVNAAIATIPLSEIERTPTLCSERSRLQGMIDELEQAERTRAAEAEAKQRAEAVGAKVQAFQSRALEVLEPFDRAEAAMRHASAAIEALLSDYSALMNQAGATRVHTPALGQFLGPEAHGRLVRLHRASAVLQRGA